MQSECQLVAVEKFCNCEILQKWLLLHWKCTWICTFRVDGKHGKWEIVLSRTKGMGKKKKKNWRPNEQWETADAALMPIKLSKAAYDDRMSKSRSLQSLLFGI